MPISTILVILRAPLFEVLPVGRPPAHRARRQAGRLSRRSDCARAFVCPCGRSGSQRTPPGLKRIKCPVGFGNIAVSISCPSCKRNSHLRVPSSEYCACATSSRAVRNFRKPARTAGDVVHGVEISHAMGVGQLRLLAAHFYLFDRHAGP